MILIAGTPKKGPLLLGTPTGTVYIILVLGSFGYCGTDMSCKAQCYPHACTPRPPSKDQIRLVPRALGWSKKQNPQFRTPMLLSCKSKADPSLGSSQGVKEGLFGGDSGLDWAAEFMGRISYCIQKHLKIGGHSMIMMKSDVHPSCGSTILNIDGSSDNPARNLKVSSSSALESKFWNSWYSCPEGPFRLPIWN